MVYAYLQWYRDKGRGQEAAELMLAEESVDVWPIARIYGPAKYLEKIWDVLMKRFEVNAMTWYPVGWTMEEGYQ